MFFGSFLKICFVSFMLHTKCYIRKLKCSLRCAIWFGNWQLTFWQLAFRQLAIGMTTRAFHTTLISVDFSTYKFCIFYQCSPSFSKKKIRNCDFFIDLHWKVLKNRSQLFIKTEFSRSILISIDSPSCVFPFFKINFLKHFIWKKCLFAGI